MLIAKRIMATTMDRKARAEMVAAARKKFAKYQQAQNNTQTSDVLVPSVNKSAVVQNSVVTATPSSNSSTRSSPRLQPVQISPHKMSAVTPPPHVSTSSAASGQVNSHRRSVDLLVEEKNSWIQKHTHLQLQLQSAQSQLQQSHHRAHQLQVENSELKREVTELKQQLDNLKVQNLTVMSHVNRAEEESRDLGVKYAEAVEKIQVLTQLMERKEHLADIDEHEREKSEMSEEERQELAEKRQVVDRLMDENQDLHLEQKQLKSRIQELEDQNSNLAEQTGKQIVELKSQLEQAVIDKSELETALSELQQQFDQLTQAHEELQERLHETRQALEEAREYIPPPAAPSNEDENDDRVSREQYETVLQQFSGLQMTHDQLTRENVDLLSQLEELRRRVVEVMDEKAQWLDQVDTLKRRLSHPPPSPSTAPAVASIDEHQQPPVKEDSAEREEERKELMLQLNELQAERARLKQQIDQIQFMNEQLIMESETIPDYIEKYHQERQLLKQKAAEKDKVILHMAREYAGILKSLEELRSVMAISAQQQKAEVDGNDGESKRAMREMLNELSGAINSVQLVVSGAGQASESTTIDLVPSHKLESPILKQHVHDSVHGTTNADQQEKMLEEEYDDREVVKVKMDEVVSPVNFMEVSRAFTKPKVAGDVQFGPCEACQGPELQV